MSRSTTVTIARVQPRRAVLAAMLLLPALAFGLWNRPVDAQEAPVEIPAPATALIETGTSATAVFAGGCFWGVQGVFQH
ncbi:MAG: msrA, partial [Devosia sp.]|nr:msrA [Devosia sp.]